MPGTNPFSIKPVRSEDELDCIRTLFRTYVDWLDIDLSYQGFEEELAGLPGKYALPLGDLLLAVDKAGSPLGCVAMRPLEGKDICEMKRLYVMPAARGLGVGASLVEAVLQLARRCGYQSMRLDTLQTMTGAISLYRQAGFVEIPAYYDTPIKETLFYECRLQPL